MVIQRVKKRALNKYEAAITYYRLLFTINEIEVSNREIELVAFIALNGNLYEKGNKEKFIEMYKSSIHTVYNMITPLVNKNILVREGRYSLKVNDQILPDFNSSISLILQIEKLWTEEKTEDTTT